MPRRLGGPCQARCQAPLRDAEGNNDGVCGHEGERMVLHLELDVRAADRAVRRDLLGQLELLAAQLAARHERVATEKK